MFPRRKRMVDSYALIAKVKSGEFDVKELRKLKKFERKETSESVRLSKFDKGKR